MYGKWFHLWHWRYILEALMKHSTPNPGSAEATVPPATADRSEGRSYTVAMHINTTYYDGIRLSRYNLCHDN